MSLFRLTGTLAVLLASLALAGSASADIQTFWKTDFCPDFGGFKPPIGVEVGIMEAPLDTSGLFGGTGGPFCVLFSTPRVTLPFPAKNFFVNNGTVDATPGDLVDIGGPFDPWACVVCQYEDKVGAHPALSVLGTAILMGGLLSGVLYELRRRQDT